MKKLTLTDGAALVVWLLPAVYLSLTYTQLPQNVPMQYGLDGTVNRFGHKSELFILLGMPVLIYLLFRFLPAIDPKKVRYGEATFKKLALGIVVFLSAINIVIIFSTLHRGLNPGKFVLPAVGLLFAFIGNVMYSIKPNYFAGIRTPWTLENADNWRSTHQLAGKIWFAGGIMITIAVLLLPVKASEIVFKAVLVVLVFIPVIYSYIFFKKHQPNQNS